MTATNMNNTGNEACNMSIEKNIKTVIDALEDKKAENIKIINIGNISSVADYFIITNGNNKSQVQALADNVAEKLAHEGIHAKQTEGYNSANWILMDYTDFVIHIFDKESRPFYDLERIWRDGTAVEVSEFRN